MNDKFTLLIDKSEYQKRVLNEECIEKEFTWSDDKEDEDLYKNGVILIWVAGRTKAIQKFVEALSYMIGSKCDFSFVAGRAHIDIYKDAKQRALVTINDEEFMNQFIVPYSQESYNNETYFEILH